jgi:hypothetical protein
MVQEGRIAIWKAKPEQAKKYYLEAAKWRMGLIAHHGRQYTGYPYDGNPKQRRRSVAADLPLLDEVVSEQPVLTTPADDGTVEQEFPVMTRHVLNGNTYQEIADELHLKSSYTAKSRCDREKQRFRKKYQYDA